MIRLSQFVPVFLMLFLSSCSSFQNEGINPPGDGVDYASFVNPFIGTRNMGHTFPGATTPFGMVQLSPETDNQVLYINGEYNPDAYRYCSGYQYDDRDRKSVV